MPAYGESLKRFAARAEDPAWFDDAGLHLDFDLARTRAERPLFEISGSAREGGVEVLTFDWKGTGDCLQDLGEDLFPLFAFVLAEEAYIRRRVAEAAVEFEIVTGHPEAEGHGHHVVLRIVGGAIPEICRFYHTGRR